jgi:hypothetical protein
MSTTTSLSHGIIHKLEDTPVKILGIHKIKGISGVIHYNPSLARDDDGNLWISVRSCSFPQEPVIHNGLAHPMHYQNHFHVGLLDEDTLEVHDMKELHPEEPYDGFQWGFEDGRLFWRDDGLHAIGVVLPVSNGDYRTCQAEILLDHKKGTYKLIKNYGQPFGVPEKNWMPPERFARLFDFIYSPTQIVLEGEVIGEKHQLDIHGGTQLVKYGSGYLSIGHVVTSVKKRRTYAQVACRWDKRGKLTHISQFFHLDVGWRVALQESIEFVSGAVWAKDKEEQELLISLGVKDELSGIARIDVSQFKWQPYGDISWYGWHYATPPSYVELPTPATDLKGVHSKSLVADPA